MSGRTLEGKWEILEGKSGGTAKVAVEAKEGWRDGIQPDNVNRRIVFAIYSGKTVPYARPDDPTGKLAIMCRNPKAYYQCYWLIDELVKIDAPLKTREAGPVAPTETP